MKTKNAFCGLAMSVALQLGVLAGSAQTNIYLFTGSETNITLNPGTYIIIAYGASGGRGPSYGSAGDWWNAEFNFSMSTTVTLLVGGVGGDGVGSRGGGGGGGSFVVEGSTPLVIAGGGGGGGNRGSWGGWDGTNGAAGGFPGDAGGDGPGGTAGGGGGGGIGIDSRYSAGGGGGGFLGDGTDGTGYGSLQGGGSGGGAGGGSFESGGGAIIGGGYGSPSFSDGGFGGGGGGGTGYVGGGGGGGGYSGGGGAGDKNGNSDVGGGGGGGSIIDSSAIAILVPGPYPYAGSGGNGEIIIIAVPPPLINADGSIYNYSTNTDGTANIVSYAGPPWVATIPTNINGLTVTTIGEGAFEDTALTSATIPNSVTSIGDDAFEETALTNITVPNRVTNIGVAAFGDCFKLTSVTIPNSVTSIGAHAFDSCDSLTSVTIPNSVTSIGTYAFFYCSSLTSATIPNSVTSIGDYVFLDCFSLTSVMIPNSVTSIGQYAFVNCTSLTNVTIPNSISSIGANAFAGTGLTSVTIPGSVTSIGPDAFDYCTSLMSVYFTGDAPSPTNDTTVFASDPATVYYLPGTTGWGAMFDGLPTAPWFLPNPVILNHSAGFGGQPGGFGFTISWATNASVVVEAATNLANPVWIQVSTNTLTGGTNHFSDPQWTNYPERFYRAVGAFTVSVTLTGLPAGDTVTLQDNGSDNLTLSTNGMFTFPTALLNGQSYSVTISGTSGATPPNITLMNGSGTISDANVTNVAVQCTRCPAFTGNMDLDMYNAAVSDGTAHGGVPAVMVTTFGGPFRVTARSFCSDGVAEAYSSQCKVATIVGTTSCSSTTLPTGTVVIQFGGALVCGGGPYEY